MGFLGYRRADGRVGVRNHVVVMSSVSCANAVAQQIGRAVPGVKVVTHTEGCGRGPSDVAIALRVLANLASHPNAASVLIVGLGCEVVQSELIASRAGAHKRIERVGIQESGGTPRTVEAGAAIARDLVREAQECMREEVGFEHLTLAVECGGSDGLSGLTANPSIGWVADWLVARGGTVLLSEMTEFLGTEALLAERCADAEVASRLLGRLERHRELVGRELGPMAHTVIAPGNRAGGLSTIQEKSLGCLRKGGTTPIQEVLEYGETPSRRGLCVMDTPGSDIFSITGKVAGGAQIVLFSTGRGSPAGTPIAPVVKIASNTPLRERMPDDIDFDAGRIVDGMSIEACGTELAALVAQVASGASTAPERTGTELFAIHTVGPAF